jgi:hypothetical protein
MISDWDLHDSGYEDGRWCNQVKCRSGCRRNYFYHDSFTDVFECERFQKEGTLEFISEFEVLFLKAVNTRGKKK